MHNASPRLVNERELPVGEAFLTDLINELAELPQPLILVLDDYHVIETQNIHDGLAFLIDHAPAFFHIVIVTRADPPLPLARLRARSQMLDLRLADLRFTTQEITEFLNTVMRLHLSEADLSLLETSTEGWVAGLQMAGLSLEGKEDASAFIRSFSAENRYILDYLFEEVFQRQPGEIQDFLLHTSILEQLYRDLCDAVTLRDDGQRMLGIVEQRNLFLIPLDDQRKWYRYHALFAELLRGSLKQGYPDRMPILHARASIWFEQQGLIADAIHHALAAGDGKRVAGLISANVFALLEQNQLTAVARQLEGLLGGESRARPWLWIGRAWLAAYTGRLDSVQAMLHAAEADLDHLESTDEQRALHGHCLTIRAFADWVAGRHTLAQQTARQALDDLNESDFTIRCLAATVLGLSHSLMTARARALEQALVYAKKCAISHITFFAHGCWAYELVLEGRLSKALDFCQESLRLAKSNTASPSLPTLSYVHAMIALVRWQRNDLETALQHARKAVALARRWEQADALHFAYTILGDTLFATGAAEEAFAVVQKAWQLAHRTSRWFEELSLSQEVEWDVLQGNPASALQRLRLAQIDIEEPTVTRVSWLLELSIAQLFLAQERYEKALASLSFILERLAASENRYLAVRALAVQALAYYEVGDKKRALAALEDAFTLAEAEGHIRSFRVAGDSFVRLLQEARRAGIHAEYVDRLLACLCRGDRVQVRAPGRGPGLIEPLSGREAEVVNLLAQGCPDKKIAETLFIARETVHKHLKNIYGKLGVHNRTEAVARARELGLI